VGVRATTKEATIRNASNTAKRSNPLNSIIASF
jgi:hypothetical protein